MNPLLFSLFLLFSTLGGNKIDVQPQDVPTCPASFYDAFQPTGLCTASCVCQYVFLGVPGQMTPNIGGSVNGTATTFTIGTRYVFALGDVVCFAILGTTPCCFTVTGCP